MAKTKISEFSATPANNTDIDSINIAEGCAPSGINDAIRELMAQLKDFQTGAVGDSFNGPVGTTTAAAGAFTTLSASGAVTLSGGTANGVAYLNGSKVVTSGSNLTYDATNIALKVSNGTQGFVLGVGGEAMIGSDASTYYYGAGWGGAPAINFQFGSTGTTYQRWLAGGSEQMRLTSTGLGIGTSSPSQRLALQGSSTTYALAETTGTGTSSGFRMKAGASSDYTLYTTQGVNQFSIYDNVASADRLTISSSGNVGIGTSSPAAKLHIAVASAAVDGTKGVRITNPAGTIAVFECGSVGDSFIGTTSGSDFNIRTGNTVRATFDNAGNLGLGVTPSAWYTSFGTKAFQFAASGSVHGLDVSSSDRRVALANNDFINTSGADTYINTGHATKFQQVAGTFQFFTAPSGTAGNAITFTQAMTLDASGNLGVGNTSPQARFHSTAGATSQAGIFEANNAVALLSFVSNATSSYTRVQLGAAGNDMVMYTTGTERARITSGGRFLVGTTTTTYPINFRLSSDSGDWFARFSNTVASAPFGVVFEYTAAAPNGGANEFLYCSDTGGLRMSVRSNGGIANYSANDSNLSDRREKTNFAPAKSYLDVICAIPVQTFNYIDQNLEEDDGLTLGVVAQDVQAVAPELVMESNWGSKDDPKMRLSIYQTDLQYALMKCIQEQQAIIESLKARLDAANL